MAELSPRFMASNIVFLLSLICHVTLTWGFKAAKNSKASTLLDQLLSDYDKHLPPKADEPTEVQLGIYIISFYSISEQTMDYSVSMYFRQRWVDERLAYKAIQGRRNVTRLGEGSWKRIWIPDTFLRNEKRASFHEVTVNNRLLRLSSTGLLWYVIKVSATLSCPMKLHKYPLDTQVCPMMFESFGYTMDNIYFSWQDKPVEIETGLQLPQFKLQSHFLYDCVQNYTAGSFPCLEIRFILRRDIGYFLIQVYVPSMLIVILSWVSFWINVEASPARVSIGLLTVLTMTTQSAGVNASLPRVSYIKAVDVWMSMCLIFVFVGLLEYALVNVMSRRKARTVAKIREGFIAVDPQGVVVRQPAPRRSTQSHSVDETWSGPNETIAQNNCAFEKEKNTPVKKLDKNSPERLLDSCHHKSPLRRLQNETTIPPPVSPSRSHTLPRVQRHYYHHHHHHQTTTNQYEMQSVQVIATQNKNQICVFKRINKNKNTTTSSLMNPRQEASPELMDGMKHAKEIDRMSRKLFPASFVLFNIFYWIVYAMPYMHYTFRAN